MRHNCSSAVPQILGVYYWAPVARPKLLSGSQQEQATVQPSVAVELSVVRCVQRAATHTVIDDLLGQVIHVDALAQVLAQLQPCALGTQQVRNHLLVDLQAAHFAQEAHLPPLPLPHPQSYTLSSVGFLIIIMLVLASGKVRLKTSCM